MSVSKKIVSLRGLELYYEDFVAEDVREAIASTVLGNPGGIRYQQLDALNKIREIRPLHFFPLRRNGELIYVMALAERITRCGKFTHSTFYVRYVSFNPVWMSGNQGLQHSGRIQKLGNSILKEGIRSYADKFEGELSGEADDPQQKLYYAYVENSNVRSMNFTAFFFSPIREFRVFMFSRFFPQTQSEVRQLQGDEADAMYNVLGEFYKDYSFYFLDRKDIEERYFVYKKQEEIIGGVRAREVSWEIVQLPGFAGKILKGVLPFLPVFRRIIQQKKFRFICFDTFYWSHAHAGCLPALMEGVCARFRCSSGMIYLDSEDPLCRVFEEGSKMGLLGKLYQSARGSVLARFVNMDEKTSEEFKTRLVFLSGYDLT